ncbi:hypothetical protein AMTR_s00055p00188820 [Amborella trichopoda]|uniref:Uncharacterized protein n=1 Tax=Amborella trichopoda TaxID=13333 RepID=U5D7V6_AMBTC|nr:hypothetical protein AMTR_s00055p00188820 [Amborella trichopoda]
MAKWWFINSGLPLKSGLGGYGRTDGEMVPSNATSPRRRLRWHGKASNRSSHAPEDALRIEYCGANPSRMTLNRAP